MKHTRTNEARWDEARKRWRIDVQRDGKRRSFYSSTPGRNGKAECHRKADTWLDEGLPDGGNTRCGVLLDAYLADAESSTSYSNWRKSESISRIRLRPVIENKRIEDLTPPSPPSKTLELSRVFIFIKTIRPHFLPHFDTQTS